MKTSPEQDSSSDNTEQDTPTHRNVEQASSTQFQTTTLLSRTVRIQAEDPNVTTMLQDMLKASKNRFGKLVETLQGNQTSMHAEGGGMKAKPHKYGGEATDGGVDAWLSLMRMYLEDSRGSVRTKVLTLLTILHKHAQAWIMQKPAEERATRDKFFTLLSKRFGIGDSPNDARLQFDVRRQAPDEKLATFLDHLEALRIKAAPAESVKTRNLEIMRKFMVRLQDEELQQSLLTSYTGEYYLPPSVEQIRSKCHDCITLRRVNRKKNQ